MSLRERAALGVLAGQADRNALGDEARKGEGLGVAPVDAASLQRFGTSLELAEKLRMHCEPFRDADELTVELAKALAGNGRHDSLAEDGRPRVSVIRGAPRAERLSQALVGISELGLHAGAHRVDITLGQDAFGNEPGAVLRAYGRVLRDPGRHQRLRVR